MGSLMNKKKFRHLTACSGGLLCSLTMICSPLPTKGQEAAPAKPAATMTLDKATLQKDIALQATISLEARRMPLSELLAAAQKQSGIILKAAADSPATRALMTARLKDVTLASLMTSLSRIYDVRWTKEGGGYTMHGSDKDALSYRLIRYQGLDASGFQDREAANREDDALAEEIVNSLDREAWKTPEGVPVTELPEDVQDRLRGRFEPDGIKAVILQERLERVFASQTFQLRLHIAPQKSLLFRPNPAGSMERTSSAYFKMARLMAYTADGRFVAAVFPEFHGPRQEPVRPLSQSVTRQSAQPEDPKTAKQPLR